MSRRFTVILSDDLWAKIQAQAIVEQRDISSLIRYSLTQYIDKFKLVIPEFTKYAAQYPKFYDKEL
jgi:predicted transcriptional regulator